MAGELSHAGVGSALAQAEWTALLAHVLDGQARGDMIMSNAAGTGLIRLPIGTTGQRLAAGANDPGYVDGPPRVIYIPAEAMVPPASNGAALGQTDGTNISYTTGDFDQTTEEHLDFHFRMTDDYDAGNITWRALWTAAGGSGAQTIAWEINILPLINDEVIDAALTDIGSITDALIATGDLHTATLTQSSNLPDAGDVVLVRVSRDVASDNLAADAQLIAIVVEFNELDQ